MIKKNAQTMKLVAERCSSYNPSKDCGCGSCPTNSTAGENVTCQTCSHYNKENVCDLDLYAKIVENHDL